MKRKPKWVQKAAREDAAPREPAEKRPSDMGKMPMRSIMARRRAILSHKTSSKG